MRAAGPLAVAGPGCRLALRPEMLSLEDGGPRANQLEGTLRNVIFKGSIVRLVIGVGGAELFLDRFNAPHLALPEIGSPVTVGFAREACLVSEGAEPVAVGVA